MMIFDDYIHDDDDGNDVDDEDNDDDNESSKQSPQNEQQFLDASTHLCKRVYLSIGPLVRPSVHPSVHVFQKSAKTPVFGH